MTAAASPRVLFVCYGGGHVRMVLALLAELKRRGRIDPLVLGLTSARAEVLAAGLPCLGFADFMEEGDADAIALGQVLAARLPVLATDLRESAAYLGLSWSDLARERGQAQADAMYARHGRQVFLPVATLERILRRTGAQALVATSAPRAERAAIVAARRVGIPALCMVDLFAAYEIAWLGEPGFADRICVLNAGVRRRLLEAGRHEDEVVVTGNPAFDSVSDAGVRARGLDLRRERGWNGRKVVLWASQVEPTSHPANPARGDATLPARILDCVRSLLPVYPHMELVVRPHPSEPPGLPPQQPREWLSGRGEDLHVLLHACDIVVVVTSTVGIEAHLAGCHVVQVLGSIYSADAPYLAFGIADQAVALRELPQALASALVAPGSNRRAADSAGGAAARVADELQRLLA